MQAGSGDDGADEWKMEGVARSGDEERCAVGKRKADEKRRCVADAPPLWSGRRSAVVVRARPTIRWCLCVKSNQVGRVR